MKPMTIPALVIGMSLLAGPAGVRTAGAACSAECAPRIEEQCGTLQGRPRRACRRQLVQACRQSTPLVACTTTSDMTLALADRSFALEPATGGGILVSGELTLCGDGRFTSGPSSGTWEVTITNGALTLNLRAAPPAGGIVDGTSNTILVGEQQTVRVARADEDTVLFDDREVESNDAGPVCSAGPGGAPGVRGPSAGAVDLGLGEALAGHALITIENDVSFGRRTTILVLCASGRYIMEVAVSAAPGRVQDSTGTWSAGVERGRSLLTLTDARGSTRQLVLEEDAAGGLVLDGLPVREGDRSVVPGICAAL